MKNETNTIGQTLVAFHIRRGGMFNNPGYKMYIGQDKTINEFTYDLFEIYENYYEVSSKVTDKPNLENLLQLANDEDNQNAYNRLKNWGLDLGKKEYYTSGGRGVGLYVDNDGTGTIDEDGEYNTTIVRKLEDCSEEECMVILRDCGEDLVRGSVYRAWASQEVIEYCAEVCGIETEQNQE